MGRGGSTLRRHRKQFLLDTFGNGKQVACRIGFPGCVGMLDETTLTVDRWPIPGSAGGSYRYSNIRPACQSCNERHAKNPDFQFWVHHDALDRRGRAARLG